MSEVYAARLTAKKHINEQCAECNIKKNSNGLYNHDDIVKTKETIEGKLKEVFLDHVSGLTMADLLDTKNNDINSVTTTQMVTADAGRADHASKEGRHGSRCSGQEGGETTRHGTSGHDHHDA